MDGHTQENRHKLLKYFGIYIKTTLYIVIFGQISMNIFDNYEKSVCGEKDESMIAVVYDGCIGMIVFNLIAVVYIIIQNDFTKMEFYIMYGMNFAWFLIMIVYSFLDMASNATDCSTAIVFRKAYVFLAIKRQMEAIMMMKVDSDIILRQVNVCSNTVFAVLVIFSPSQTTCFDGAYSLALGIAFVNIVGYLFFSFLNLGELKFKFEEDVKKAIKFVSILISCGFFLVFIMAVNSRSQKMDTSPKCVPIIYIINTYVYIVPISMVGMVWVFWNLSKNQSVDQELQETHIMFSTTGQIPMSKLKEIQLHDSQAGNRAANNHSPITKYYTQQQNLKDSIHTIYPNLEASRSKVNDDDNPFGSLK